MSESSLGWVAANLEHTPLTGRVERLKNKAASREATHGLFPELWIHALAFGQLRNLSPRSRRRPALNRTTLPAPAARRCAPRSTNDPGEHRSNLALRELPPPGFAPERAVRAGDGHALATAGVIPGLPLVTLNRPGGSLAMTPEEANRVAFHAIRSILDAAPPSQLEVAGTSVTIRSSRDDEPAWRPDALGLEADRDGPWPAPLRLECRWEGGTATLLCSATHWRGTDKNGLVGIDITADSDSLVWITVPDGIRKAGDHPEAKVAAWFALQKNKSEAHKRAAEELRDRVRESSLPLLSDSRIEAFSVALPDGAVLPDPAAALRRLVLLALYKLDFMSLGPAADRRGRPLIEVQAFTGGFPTATTAPSKESETDDGEAVTLSPPLNLILCGPPGTGKTYALMTRYTPFFEERAPRTLGNYDAEVLDGATWFQVVVLALKLCGGEADVARLAEHPLVRAKHAARPLRAPSRARLWATLQTHTVESSTTVHYKKRHGDLVFDKREDGTWFFAETPPEDALAWIEEVEAGPRAKRPFEFVTFHQSFSYEDFVEGIRPRLDDPGAESSTLGYEILPGVFRRAAEQALAYSGYQGSLQEFCGLTREERARQMDGASPYAVFVDEINRGNVSRVFGELITLLEEDKRLGAANEIIVRLPYSRAHFGVPANLHLIGTMNTADRSVEALDTALRRRFAFEEVMPRPDLLSFTVEGGIDMRRLLETINRRLHKLYDRDHLIGHAFFMPLKTDPSLMRLKAIFARSILPLLQEYFHGDWGRIGLVLGPDFVVRRSSSKEGFAKFSHEEAAVLEERITYELADVAMLSNLAFRRVYENVSADDPAV